LRVTLNWRGLPASFVRVISTARERPHWRRSHTSAVPRRLPLWFCPRSLPPPSGRSFPAIDCVPAAIRRDAAHGNARWRRRVKAAWKTELAAAADAAPALAWTPPRRRCLTALNLANRSLEYVSNLITVGLAEPDGQLRLHAAVTCKSVSESGRAIAHLRCVH